MGFQHSWPYSLELATHSYMTGVYTTRRFQAKAENISYRRILIYDVQHPCEGILTLYGAI